MIEIPAGLVKQGEKEEEAARRELEEETGFVAKNIKKVAAAYASPGYSSELIKYYLATGLVREKQKYDEDEHIKVEVLKVKDALLLIKKNQIRDNKTIIGINIARDIKRHL